MIVAGHTAKAGVHSGIEEKLSPLLHLYILRAGVGGKNLAQPR
jgi:hypothetical protein